MKKKKCDISVHPHDVFGEIYEVNDHLEVGFLGDDEATAALLAALVRRGFKVISFSEVTSDLEEVFLRLTKGDVA